VFMKNEKEYKIQIRSDKKTRDRILAGAEKKGFRSMSDYVRNAVLAELIRDGVE